MEDKYSLEIQEKQQKIETVKDNFEREVLKKIGDVLIHEIEKKIQTYKIKFDGQKNQLVSIQFPGFLKSVFNLFNKDNLLTQTSLLYIFLNLGNLPPEYEEKYNSNIKKILKILKNSSEIKKLIIINSESVDNSHVLAEVQIPETLIPQFNQLGENTAHFLIYGVLAIINWLELLSPKYLAEYKIYEEFFQKNSNC